MHKLNNIREVGNLKPGKQSTIELGVFFKYEFSSIQLDIKEYHYSILEFILSICAILGGIFTCFGNIFIDMLGLMDGCCYQSTEYLNKSD